MDIDFKGQYDKRTFFRAVWIANQPARSQKRFIRLMLLFAIGALVLILYRIFTTQDFSNNSILFFAALIILVVLFSIILRPIFTAVKLWGNPGVKRTLKGKITSDGISYHLEQGTNKIVWDRISRVRKISDLITFVRNDGLLLIFPKRFFRGDPDWQRFLKLIENKVNQIK